MLQPWGSAIVRQEDQSVAQILSIRNTCTFKAEISIHFPGPKKLDMPIVWVFPTIKICLECGRTEFDIPESELRVLKTEEIEAA